MKRISYQLLAGLTLCGLFSFCLAIDSFAGWKELKQLPTHRWGLEIAAVGTKVYAIGGQDDTPRYIKTKNTT